MEPWYFQQADRMAWRIWVAVVIALVVAAGLVVVAVGKWNP